MGEINQRGYWKEVCDIGKRQWVVGRGILRMIDKREGNGVYGGGWTGGRECKESSDLLIFFLHCSYFSKRPYCHEPIQPLILL